MELYGGERKNKMPKTIFFKGWECSIVQQHYQDGKRLAIQLVSARTIKHEHLYKGDSIATATVNVPQLDLLPNQTLIKDYAENEGMFEALFRAGIISPPLDSIDIGFIKVLLCEFKQAAADEYAPE